MSFNEQAKHTMSVSSDDRCVLGRDMFADIRSNLSPAAVFLNLCETAAR